MRVGILRCLVRWVYAFALSIIRHTTRMMPTWLDLDQAAAHASKISCALVHAFRFFLNFLTGRPRTLTTPCYIHVLLLAVGLMLAPLQIEFRVRETCHNASRRPDARGRRVYKRL